MHIAPPHPMPDRAGIKWHVCSARLCFVTTAAALSHLRSQAQVGRQMKRYCFSRPQTDCWLGGLVQILIVFSVCANTMD